MGNFKEEYEKLSYKKKLLKKESKREKKEQKKQNLKIYKKIVKKSRKLSKNIAKEINLKIKFYKSPKIIKKIENFIKRKKTHTKKTRIEIGKHKYLFDYKFPKSFSFKRKFKTNVIIFIEFNYTQNIIELKVNQEVTKLKFDAFDENSFIETLEENIRQQILDSLKIDIDSSKPSYLSDSASNL